MTPHGRLSRAAGPAAAATAFSFLGLGLTAVPAGAVQHPDGTITIDIAAITDFHGALDQAPEIAGRVDALRGANADTAFVSVGDNIGGSTFESSIQDDNPTIEVLNAAGLDASAVGNHEFDRGYTDLRARIDGTDPDLVQTQFPYLGANVEGEDPELASYEVWESPSGVDVAFVGAVTTTTAQKVSPSGIEGITFSDEAAAVNEVAAALSDGDTTNGEADVVIALVHAPATDALTGGISADVDALFAGDSHLEVNTTVDGLPVLQTVNGGEQLAHLALTYDPATGETTVAGQTIVPVDGTGPVDAEVQAIVDAANEAAAELGQQEVGTVTASFNRATNDGVATGSNRGAESTLGNLVAEAFQWKAEDLGQAADLGVVNPGGLRADLDPNGDGIVTYSEAATVSPFGNTLTIVDLTGEQVVQLLEQQWTRDPAEDHPVLRLGLSDEVRFFYDPTAQAGEKVRDVEIDGEPLDPAATYSVATINFLAEGGDGFTVFTEAGNVNDTGYIDLQALVDYLGAHPDLAPDYSQRSVGITFTEGDPLALLGGEQVSVDLASLAFTSDEPKPETVTVTVEGEALATAAVDVTPTPRTDETGRATVAFTVPESLAPGPHQLTFATELDTFSYGVLVDEAAAVPPGHGAEHPGKGNVPDHVKDKWRARQAAGR